MGVGQRRRGAGAAVKLTLVLHRYLGVAVGLLMTLWCLSGFVMMYQGYPDLTRAERLQGLEPLAAHGFEGAAPYLGDGPWRTARVEMLGGEPVLRLAGRRPATVDLTTGAEVSAVDGRMARTIAGAYARGHGLSTGAMRSVLVDKDQWTVQGAAARGPVYRIALDDRGGTELYVAQASGEIVQQTTRRERWLSWFGAVPHWLYPTVLRQDGALWTEVVIWSSVVGVFLTVTGLVIGVVRLRKRANGRWSPFRGVWFWHHMIGLVFGVLTLAWVASGLLTMGPWGLLQSSDGAFQAMRRISTEVKDADLGRFLDAAVKARGGGTVMVQAAPLNGRMFVIAYRRDGSIVRLDDAGRPAPLSDAELLAALKAGEGPAIAAFERIDREDAYYYGHHDPVKLPAYRAVLADPAGTTIYLDADTGTPVRVVDDAGRASRWLRTGLHDFDFPGLRTRPVWNIVVGLLLAGVTAVCATGFWMSLDRIRRDWAGWRARFRSP